MSSAARILEVTPKLKAIWLRVSPHLVDERLLLDSGWLSTDGGLCMGDSPDWLPDPMWTQAAEKSARSPDLARTFNPGARRSPARRLPARDLSRRGEQQ